MNHDSMLRVMLLLTGLFAGSHAGAQSATQPAPPSNSSLQELQDSILRGRRAEESTFQQGRERVRAMQEKLRALLPRYVAGAVVSLEREGVLFGDIGEAMRALASHRDADRKLVGKLGRVGILSVEPGGNTAALVSLEATPWFAITFEGRFHGDPAAWAPDRPCAYHIAVTDQFSDAVVHRVDCSAFDTGEAQARFDGMLQAKAKEVLERVSRLRNRR